MGCTSCSTGGCAPAGCKSNGSCLTGGCGKLDIHDWLADMAIPTAFTPFNLIEVKFKGARKDFFRNTSNIYLEAGELVVVEGQAGGFDVGHVTMTGELVRMQLKKKAVKDDADFKKVVRKAGEKDVEKWTAAKTAEPKTLQRARTIALELKLSMKLSDVDFQGDKSKATFYYTAEGRVDFRELIKRYADEFKVRIEMRQIGMRQEASRLGGIGSCGRELCCSTWLTDFKTVSTSAARYQNLAINTLKLAGQCGKLKCCLNYELDTYIDALKDFPKDVEKVETERGQARWQKTDIFKRLMWFSFQGDENWVAVDVKRVREVIELNKQGKKPADLLTEEAIIAKAAPPKPVLDYLNVVGQDSLTRMDDKNKKGKSNNNKRRNNNNRNKNRNQQQNRSDNKPNTDTNKPA